MVNKSFRHTLFGFIILFSFFLIIGNIYVYKQQRNILFNSFSQLQQIELKLLSQLAKESLLTENYSLIEWFFKRWAEDRKSVIYLSLKSDNGFSIIDYQRPTTSEAETISNSASILMHDEIFQLNLTSETSEISQLLNQLLKQLILVSSIATLLLGITIWYLIKYLSIRPLLHEIKLRHNAEQEIQQQHQFLQAVINSVKDGIMVINTNYEVQLSNEAAKNLMVSNKHSNSDYPYCYKIFHHRDNPCDGPNHPCPLQMVLKTGQHASVIHNYPDPNGNERHFELLASPLFDNNGQITGVIETSRELTSHIKLQNELEEKRQHFDHLAHHDPLTSLPNRLLFTDRLEQAQLKSNRTGEPFALLYIDLDQFKQINDSVGHSVGDEVLVQTAKNLRECIRADDTIARVGGDEFTIILSSFHNVDTITDIAQKIIHSVQKTMLINGKNYHLSSSIGISIYPQDTDSTEMLIRNADSAMFKVKEQGRNAFQFYTEDLTQRALKRVELEHGMHNALIENHFTAWYQPQYEISSGKLIGMEALLRWEDPQRGIISPVDFIPLAEESGLIIELGKQIIDQVMQQTVFWHNEGLDPGSIAVNLSGKQLLGGNITADIKYLLEKNQCKIEWIDLEVTEGFFMRNSEKAIKRLHELHDMGFKIAIDDFGTGYSSLAYLKHLPISKLKIDRSFVKDLPFDRDDIGISRAVIALAYGLDLEVIAEGVETKEQAEFLRKEGCPLAQGYLYSKPLPAEEVTQLIRDN